MQQRTAPSMGAMGGVPPSKGSAALVDLFSSVPTATNSAAAPPMGGFGGLGGGMGGGLGNNNNNNNPLGGGFQSLGQPPAMGGFGAAASPMPTTMMMMPAPAPATVATPVRMTTSEFGPLWGQHGAEARAFCAAPPGFQSFIPKLERALGVQLVEFIPATTEAIFAGRAPGMDGTVLVHSKERPAGSSPAGVDLIVRTKQPALTSRVVERLRSGV